MKFILSLAGMVTICLGIFLCGGKKNDAGAVYEDYMRIHIVANSNSSFDQNLKYKVKDEVVDFLIPKLADSTTKEEAVVIVYQNLFDIEAIVNQTLKEQGANYKCKVSIAQENIPTRAYDQIVLKEGVYDCLRIDLGSANGDNWWCVVFPAVCFLSSKNYSNYVYISKIWDIICSVIH